EPVNSWSRMNLLSEGGDTAIASLGRYYPNLTSGLYDEDSIDLDKELDGGDLVLVHVWNSRSMVARLGEHRKRQGYRLLFHDTHHRAVTAEQEMSEYNLSNYDGVLVYGAVLREH